MATVGLNFLGTRPLKACQAAAATVTVTVSFSVCLDFATPDEAFAELLRRQAHTDAHQKGELVLTTGGVRTAQQVGCTRCEGVISFPGKGVRLTVSYDFCG